MAVAVALLLASSAVGWSQAQDTPEVLTPLGLFSPAIQRLQIPLPRLTAVEAVTIATQVLPATNLLIAADWHRASSFVPRMTDGTWLQSPERDRNKCAWFVTAVYGRADRKEGAAQSAVEERPFDAVAVVQIDDHGRVTGLGGGRSAQALLPWIPRPPLPLEDAAMTIQKAFTSPAVLLGVEWSKAAAFRSRYGNLQPYTPIVRLNWHPWHHENPATDVAWFATVLTHEAAQVVRVDDRRVALAD
jgi:hypothetical protein